MNWNDIEQENEIDPLRQATRAWLESAWAQEAEVRAVEVEGATVRYRGWNLAATEQPGLVFVHGYMAHARWWDHIAPRFANRYRVIAPDFTGMGDSERRPEYSRRQFAREILAAADHAGLDRLTIVAHSFGAATTLYACSIATDRVARAIVIDAHIFRAERDAEMEVRPERFFTTREEAEDRFRLVPSGMWPDPDVLAYITRHAVVETPNGWTWKFDPASRPSIDRDKFRDELRNLPTPIDYIYGDRSEIVGIEAIMAMLTNAPTCGMPVAIPLCHHHVMIEQPAALVTALDALLSQPR